MPTRQCAAHADINATTAVATIAEEFNPWPHHLLTESEFAFLPERGFVAETNRSGSEKTRLHC
jgi:hypothetical protein